MPGPPLSFCVINFDGASVLSRTLASVRRACGPEDEVILVDNASADDSTRVARAALPGIRVLEMPANRGPGSARNAAWRLARHDLLLFIDNDVEIQAHCPTRLCDALLANPSAVAAMPAVLLADAPDTVQLDGATPHCLGMVSLDNPGVRLWELPRETRTIDSLITACFLFDRRRWSGSPPFDESFFLYLEDHELGLRARLLGHTLLSVPAASCLHGTGTQGVSVRVSGSYSFVRKTEMIRNRWQVLLKLYQIRTLLLLAPILLLFELLQFVGALSKGWTRAWLHAAWGTIRRLPHLLRSRSELQRARVVGDRAVLKGGPVPFNAHLLKTGLEIRAGRVLNASVARYWRAVREVL